MPFSFLEFSPEGLKLLFELGHQTLQAGGIGSIPSELHVVSSTVEDHPADYRRSALNSMREVAREFRIAGSDGGPESSQLDRHVGEEALGHGVSHVRVIHHAFEEGREVEGHRLGER